MKSAKSTTAGDLGLDEATVYRYAGAFTKLGLAHEQPGYWGLLTSAQLAHLGREVRAQLHTDAMC